MCLPDPRPPGAEGNHREVICGSARKYVIVWRTGDVSCHADRGANAATARYQIANSRSHVSLRVFLRLTAMDVCCGPPAFVPAFLIA
jgi:hypothetical protein